MVDRRRLWRWVRRYGPAEVAATAGALLGALVGARFAGAGGADVAPSGVDLSGIVSYYATITVDGAADRLRDGQTAEADVRVEVADNVLRVPAAAVRRSGGQPTVTITGPDGTPVSMPFLAGLVGDDYVEVRSGLTDGDKVELPQATVTARPEDQGPPDN